MWERTTPSRLVAPPSSSSFARACALAAAVEMGTGSSRPEEAGWEAARTNNTRKLHALLVRHADRRTDILEHRDVLGRTPLVIAAARGSAECASLLLQHGGQVHALAPGKRGGTPLHAASVQGDALMADLLLQHGADPFLDNQGGLTAYDCALQAEKPALARRYEQKALFHGWLEVETKAWWGTKWSPRWCVLFLRTPCPGSDVSGHASLQLYCFKRLQSTSTKHKHVLDHAHLTRGRNHTVQVRVPTSRRPHTHTLVFRGANGGGHVDVDAFLQACQFALDASRTDEAVAMQMQAEFDALGRLDSAPTTSNASDATPWHDVQADEGIEADATNAPSAPAAWTQDEGATSNEGVLCVVCWSRPKEAGLVHGNSLHRCCCLYCATNLVSLGQPCPMCRRPIERILEVYE